MSKEEIDYAKAYADLIAKYQDAEETDLRMVSRICSVHDGILHKITKINIIMINFSINICIIKIIKLFFYIFL